MYLEAITVSVHYADFLAATIPYVHPQLDRWLIVTHESDLETRQLCHRHNLECLLTNDFYRDGADFDKARAIDHGLSLLSWRDWVLHLDSDIVLPGHFRESLEDSDLDTRCIYGCDRFSIKGWEQWQRFQQSNFLHQYSRSSHHNVCFPGGMEVGARWADIHQGYCPIGFFQLFHRDAVMFQGIRQRRYPAHGHNDASRCDVQFSMLWSRRQRVLLPEVVVAHLESEPAKVGANWSGRTTMRFGPKQSKATQTTCGPS